MGYTVRTLDWRFTEFYSWDTEACEALWDAPPRGTELYNHTGHTDPGDFDSWENENLAEGNGQLVAQLRSKLQLRFRKPAGSGSGCPPDEPAATASME